MRIVVLGAGYAGLPLARRLEDRLPDADVVVVDESSEHLLRHECHRAIRRPGVADALTVPLAATLDRAELVVDEVVDVDPEAGRAALAGGRTLSWEYGAVCLGSETATYDIPGVEAHGLAMKDLGDATAIRASFLDAAANGPVRAVVGGAGLTGVQVAGELAALAREEDVAAEVNLLEELDSVAPSFPEPFRAAVADELRARDVALHTGTRVVRATADEVVVADVADEADARDDAGQAPSDEQATPPTGDDRLPYDTFVWAGGIRGGTALSGERLQVRDDLRVSDRTFALGDAAAVVDADGEAVPASASAAVRQARTAAANIARLVHGDDGDWQPRLDPFRFDAPGWIVSVGDGAVAQLGPQVLTGAPARTLKASVGAGYLTSIEAVRNAADLVREELGYGGSAGDLDGDSPPDLDGDVEPAEVSDADDTADAGDAED